MSILVAGTALPTKVRQAAQRDNLAKSQFQKVLSGQIAPTTVGYAGIPGNPDFEFKVQADPAPFDLRSSIVVVTVRGPRQVRTESTLRGVYTVPNGAILLEQYSCLSCHTVTGLSTTVAAPPLSLSTLTASNAQRNTALGANINVDAYIEESIRRPEVFLSPGYTSADMTSYPDIDSMPQEDLNAIREYLKSIP